MAFTKARPSRRFGRDEAGEEFRSMLDDPEVDFGDIIAGAIAAAPEEMQEQVYQSLREMGEDSRGPRSWARDRLERRRLSKDADGRVRRFGRDVENMEPRGEMPSNGIQRSEKEAEDRRRGRMAGDRRMAYDASPQAAFNRMFPNASRVERA